MEEFVIEDKEEALKIVSGESFYTFMFNDVSDELSSDKIKMMETMLTKKDNKLAMLDAEKLNILYNTFSSYQNPEEKNAYNEILEAIDIKIKSFVAGKEDLQAKDIEPMLVLIQKRTKDIETVGDPEIYSTALNKTVLAGQKYDAENGLSEITKDKINLIEVNLAKMANWQKDVTNLDEIPESNARNIPEDRFLEFMQKRINGNDNASFADLHSAFIAAAKYKKDKAVYDTIVKQAEIKIKNYLNSKEILSPSDIISAKYVHDELQKADKKVKRNIKGFDKRIEKSIEKNKNIKVFDTINKIVKNTEVTGDPKLFGRKVIEQATQQGKLKKDSDLAIWLEAVRNKTLCQLITTSGLTKEEFNEKFADNVALEYLSLASVNNTFDGKVDKKSFKKLFADIGKDKKIKISQGVIIGGVTNLSNETDNFISRLETKLDKSIEGIENLKEKLSKKLTSGKILGELKEKAKSLDERATNKWGDKYLMAKGFVKSVGKQSAWVMAFNAAKVIGGATNATWVLPSVVAVSLANSTYQFGKDYFQAKKNANKKGDNLKFKDFCKKNKVRLGSLALSGAVTAATAGVLGANASSVILNSKVWVSGGLVACKIADKVAEDKKNNKSKAQIALGACLTAVTATAGYVISSVAGKGAFDSSKGFVDQSLQNDLGSEVGASFGTHGKGKDRRSKIGEKAIKIVPMNKTNVSNSAGNEKSNVAQTIMNASKAR